MQKSLNKVELKGNVGVNPKITKIENGGVIVKFSLATNDTVKGKDNLMREETMWHNIVAWANKTMPDFSLIKKGVYIEIFGKIRYVKYKDKNGDDRYFTEILAQKIIIPITE